MAPQSAQVNARLLPEIAASVPFAVTPPYGLGLLSAVATYRHPFLGQDRTHIAARPNDSSSECVALPTSTD